MSDSLLNKSSVRQFTLDALKRTRPHLAEKMTRVSPEYFERIESKLRVMIINEVSILPTSGATIK